MASARVAKLRFLRRDDNSTASDSDIKLQQGQPFIDMTTDPENDPGTLYVGQGKGSLKESGVNVKHSDEAGKLDHKINVVVDLEESDIKCDGSETTLRPGVDGVLPVANGGTGSTTFNVSNVGEGILKEDHGGTGRGDGTVVQADLAKEAVGLTEEMTFRTYLNLETDGIIKNGGTRCAIGIDGILPTSHGGTGVSNFTPGSLAFNGVDISNHCLVSDHAITDLAGEDDTGYYYQDDSTGTLYAFQVGYMWIGYIEWRGDLGKNATDRALVVTLGNYLSSGSVTLYGAFAQTALVRGSSLSNTDNTNQLGVFLDPDNGYIYVGQDANASESGVNILVLGMTGNV